MEYGAATRGALLAAAPLSGARRSWLPLSSPPSPPSIQIQNRLYSISSLPLKARGVRRCEASLASDYTCVILTINCMIR
jgi:branched-chain amino acid aminotransferase